MKPQNVADDVEHPVKERLSALMDQWMKETGDDVPEQISNDSFDRETGESLKLQEADYRGTPPGWTQKATQIHHSGPR